VLLWTTLQYKDVGCAMNYIDISIGILAWRTPKTLKATLESYRKSGLFNISRDITLFLNEVHPEDLELANEFQVKVIANDKNVGIHQALQHLIREAKCPVFLFLEGDFKSIESEFVTRGRLAAGFEALVSGECDVVRYRHRKNYGEPNYSVQHFQGNELSNGFNHLLNSIYWRDRPDLDFPDHVNSLTIGSERWYTASSKNANFTNNPCLYRTIFFKDIVCSRPTSLGIALEVEIQEWWQEQNFLVMQGEGLFQHSPLEESGHGYEPFHTVRRRFWNTFKSIAYTQLPWLPRLKITVEKFISSTFTARR
jgi:hypothetical protein